ncbi:MAG TPA: histidine phosphatase family protein [Thermodesulfobacteriota bacterium]|nr:histidine phosphatase family protein [Thermodesulfobacteriota bacterium]
MEPDQTRLYLTRHGEVVNHGVYNGQNDVDITPKAIQQMQRLQEVLKDKNLKGVYCSDLVRTQKGAEIIGQPHGLSPEAFPEFREVNFGRWQGLSYAQVMERYPTDIPQWLRDVEGFRIPEGESMVDVRRRAIPKLQELIDRHRGEEILLVCHGALNRVILAEALHLPMAHLLRIEQNYGCLNIIEYTPTWTVVKLMNG